MVMRAKITGTGMYVPERVVTNDDLAELMDTKDEWIRQRSGIAERRYITEGEGPVDLARKASERALEAANLEATDLAGFRVPPCEACGGLLKPDVVFFGESVPKSRVAEAYARLERSDAVLVVGSSLMVFSGFRFVKTAAERGVEIALLNAGRTRADEFASVKIARACGPVLDALSAPRP